jgi:rhodanese-related sulfurtransferase
MFKRTGIALAFVALLVGVSSAASATSEVPKSKHTVLGKYMTAKEAYEQVTAQRGKVLFLDIRTTGELMFVGGTSEVDAVVPFVEIKQPVAWDDKAGRFALIPNASFLTTVEAALHKKGLGKADTVLLMCRSGDRSAKAVNALAAAGYTNAWSVHDGFEGDLSKDGVRSVNGWKNAGLPWSYKLDKSKFVLGAPQEK